VDVHTARMKYKASIKANNLLKLRSVLGLYHIPSNIWYQIWRSKGQHVWLIFWMSRVQNSSSSQTIMSDGNTTCVEARLPLSTQFQLCRDSADKKAAECLLQLVFWHVTSCTFLVGQVW